MINTIALLGAWVAGVMGLAMPAPAAPAGFGSEATVAVATGHPGLSADMQAPPVQIWVEEGVDLFHPGDRVRLRLRTTEDRYVAVFHLDTDGQLELLYPESVWDQVRVRAHRTHAVPGPVGRLAVGRSAGIGYFYVVASQFPLDLRSAQPRSGLGAGEGIHRVVRGDPFWALEELTSVLVRERHYRSYAVDLYSYHVGGRHHYPAFACYDSFRRDLVDRYSYYPSCDRLRRLLVTYPYYYDTRRYRGDRAIYLRQLDDRAPGHGFKEATRQPAPPLRDAERRIELERPTPRGRGAAPTPLTDRQELRAEPPPAPARSRPTLERRPAPREQDGGERPRDGADRPRQAQPRAAPAPREPPRREPDPPSESAPRRESPPPRAAPAPRSDPPRAAPPARERGSRPERARPEPNAPEA